jgi:hypothetical protein
MSSLKINLSERETKFQKIKDNQLKVANLIAENRTG